MEKRENPASYKSYKSRKSQVTVFVIIAIIIVAAIAGYFVLKKGYFSQIPREISPLNDYYISCVKAVANDGASIMASQGGYIEIPDFEAGSEYSPFSNQLGFMGLAVPYWYYISGNGVVKEQVPTKSQMEKQLANYIASEINNKCDFGSFETSGFEVYLNPDDISARVSIADDEISISINQEMIVAYNNDTYTIESHTAKTDSRLGRYYNLATEIYEYEQDYMFLENYTSDVLYTYAPVSGAEISCSPVIWDPYSVFNDLRAGLQANLQMLKIQGDYYTPANANTPYFIVGKGSSLKAESGEQVSFLYSSDWPSRIEVWPTEGDLMIANPVGNQPGISAMGFCYVPYKFVYDVYFPVLIQIYNPTDASEVFQFPVAVVIDKNMPREAADSEFIEPVANICDNANTELSTYTYDVHLDPVEATIKFKCISDVCHLGQTKIDNETGYSLLESAVPQCVNGVIIASAPGYKEEKYFISTNEETLADIVLDKEYKLGIELYVDGVLSNEYALITVNERLDENTTDFLTTVSYPSIKEINLAEGDYNFDAKVYRSSSLTIPATTKQYCTNVPKEGLLGFFGLEEEKCVETTVPSQTISNVLGAGGSTDYYVAVSELENSRVMKIYTTSIKTPANIAQVGEVYDQITKQPIDIIFA